MSKMELKDTRFQKLEEENLKMFKLLKEIISDKNILWKFRKPYYHKLLKILEDYRSLKNKEVIFNETNNSLIQKI